MVPDKCTTELPRRGRTNAEEEREAIGREEEEEARCCAEIIITEEIQELELIINIIRITIEEIQESVIGIVHQKEHFCIDQCQQWAALKTARYFGTSSG